MCWFDTETTFSFYCLTCFLLSLLHFAFSLKVFKAQLFLRNVLRLLSAFSYHRYFAGTDLEIKHYTASQNVSECHLCQANIQKCKHFLTRIFYWNLLEYIFVGSCKCSQGSVLLHKYGRALSSA